MAVVMTSASQLDSPLDRGWGRVRSRLRQPTNEELQALRDREVADFLNSADWTTPNLDQLQISQPQRACSSAAKEHAQKSGLIRPKTTRSQTEKPRSTKPLKVDFADDPPTIIGEGGDDSKEPATTVGVARERKNSVTTEHARRRVQHVLHTSQSDEHASYNSRSRKSSSSSQIRNSPVDAFSPVLSPTSVPPVLRIRQSSQSSRRSCEEDNQDFYSYNSAESRRSGHDSRRSSRNSSGRRVSKIEEQNYTTAPNSRRASSTESDELSNADRSLLLLAAGSPRMSRHDSFDSVSSVEGCILGSTPRRGSDVSPPLRRRVRVGNTDSPAKSKPPSNRSRSFDVSATANGNLQSAMLQSHSMARLMTPVQQSRSPLCRQFSWQSDTSEKLDAEPDLAPDELPAEAILAPVPIPLPERHPDRGFMIPPLKYERNAKPAEPIQYKNPEMRHLVAPPFERRPSAPNLGCSPNLAELAAAPRFERRPSAPFINREGDFDHLHHPAFRRPSTDRIPQINDRPKPGSRRASAVGAKMERKASYNPQYPSHLSVAHTQAFADEIYACADDDDYVSTEDLVGLVPPRPDINRSVSYLDSKNAALAEFVQCTSHMAGIVGISAHSIPSAQLSTAKWLQLATFWLLKGRAGLQIYFSAQEPDSDSDLDSDDEGSSPVQHSAMLVQQHMNIFKTWWIVSEVLEVRLSEADSALEFAGASEAYRAAVFELTDALVEAFKCVALWITEHGLMPVNPVLVPGLDAGLWLQDAAFPEDMKMLRRML